MLGAGLTTLTIFSVITEARQKTASLSLCWSAETGTGDQPENHLPNPQVENHWYLLVKLNYSSVQSVPTKIYNMCEDVLKISIRKS